jgi:hypothetical protein
MTATGRRLNTDATTSPPTTAEIEPQRCPANKKATLAGGFLVSSPCGDQLTWQQVEIDGAKNVLPGIDLFSQGATPQISSALHRFTAEFEMDRSGSNAP